ncbi:MAG: hypothetical protein KUG78_08840 [Kangiellaceae bacterium]|nr:hypothetical protein [Kangiellaceae bacterium]
MSKLKLIIVGFITTSFLIATVEINATNKSSPKTQFTKKTYNKSKKRQTVTPQTKEFKVNGIQAWSEAKRNGFKFYPNESNGALNGVGEKGPSFRIENNGRCSYQDRTQAQLVGGVNMLLYQCTHTYLPGVTKTANTYAHFNLFWGKKLKSGWTIKNMKITSNAQWTNNKWRVNTNNIATKVKLTNSDSQRAATTARLVEVILVGPKNGRWEDAFDVM